MSKLGNSFVKMSTVLNKIYIGVRGKIPPSLSGPVSNTLWLQCRFQRWTIIREIIGATETRSD